METEIKWKPECKDRSRTMNKTLSEMLNEKMNDPKKLNTVTYQYRRVSNK